MFLKVIIVNLIVVWGVLFFAQTGVQAINTLNVKYLDKLPGGVTLDSKYTDVDKYVLYKYLTFSFKEEIAINSVALNFVINNEWYQKNEVKDIIFLKYDNNEWTRVDYDSKIDEGDFVKYKVNSSGLGNYWVIVGRISTNKKTVNSIITTDIKKKINNNIFRGSQEGESIEEVVKIGKEIISTLKESTKVMGATAAATTGASLSIVTILMLLGGPTNLSLLIRQIILALFGFFSLKKKYRSGIIYDINTGEPVPLARVDLIEEESSKTKTTKFTNKDGRYYFLVPKGKYYLEVRKKGYVAVEDDKTEMFKVVLQKDNSKAEVKMKEAGIIKKNIAMRKKGIKASPGIIKMFITAFIKGLARALFVVGVVFSIWVCYIDPSFFNFTILAIYTLVVVFRALFVKKPKYGIILNSAGKPEAFATVSIFDDRTKKLMSRVISNTSGRYYVVLEEGKYLLNIRTVEGASVSQKINVIGKSTLSKKLIVNIAK